MGLFKYEFGIIALIGGVLSAVSTSLLGNVVVMRRMSFLGSGIAHLTFVGVGLGLILGLIPRLTTLAVAIISALILGYLSKKGVHEDIGIGVLFSTSMALGIVLIALSKTDTSRVMAFLFGDILAMNWGDVTLIGILTVAVLVFFTFFREHIVYFTFDEDFAKILGIKIDAIYYSFLVLLAISIVLSINLLGVILISAMVVVPAASSMLLSRTYQGMFRLSPILSSISVLIGLVLSWNYDIAAGASIVLAQGGIFFLAFLVKILTD
jgi:ABC-type Mn2+/Zn2+ transport system permease subunit